MNSRMAKVKLASAKASWAEAARTNGDALNIDEFLAFTHPESSHSLMAQTGRQKPKFTLRYYILLSRHIVSTKKVGSYMGQKCLRLTKICKFIYYLDVQLCTPSWVIALCDCSAVVSICFDRNTRVPIDFADFHPTPVGVIPADEGVDVLSCEN